jgi:hypothetical protein
VGILRNAGARIGARSTFSTLCLFNFCTAVDKGGFCNAEDAALIGTLWPVYAVTLSALQAVVLTPIMALFPSLIGAAAGAAFGVAGPARWTARALADGYSPQQVVRAAYHGHRIDRAMTSSPLLARLALLSLSVSCALFWVASSDSSSSSINGKTFSYIYQYQHRTNENITAGESAAANKRRQKQRDGQDIDEI